MSTSHESIIIIIVVSSLGLISALVDVEIVFGGTCLEELILDCSSIGKGIGFLSMIKCTYLHHTCCTSNTCRVLIWGYSNEFIHRTLPNLHDWVGNDMMRASFISNGGNISGRFHYSLSRYKPIKRARVLIRSTNSKPWQVYMVIGVRHFMQLVPIPRRCGMQGKH